MPSLSDSPPGSPASTASNRAASPPPFDLAAFFVSQATATVASQLEALKAVDLNTLSADMDTWPRVRLKGSRYVLESWIYKKGKRRSWATAHGTFLVALSASGARLEVPFGSAPRLWKESFSIPSQRLRLQVISVYTAYMTARRTPRRQIRGRGSRRRRALVSCRRGRDQQRQHEEEEQEEQHREMDGSAPAPAPAAAAARRRRRTGRRGRGITLRQRQRERVKRAW
ncbi:hypothetical protein B0T26DRAFT_682669 [Lasiosphaeria miniovina]|uniref:Uncharacterized protein n=1 Tax=Lasiosphaeria miniovina TaxID=1954250 RepID=A0AA40BEZ5_9PEZI|nr:uncharacterized protein B0T26DRAFT_682669 [Lasiosphaeria miniovina]KAK0733036.1 hypothetical protein B0T26DRAFT_682669 [Lasiosphaeria miniovina]